MTVSLDSTVAKELISFKLNSLQTTFNDILYFWNHDTFEQFIDNATSGILENAEMDAIIVRQLVNDIDKLQSLLKSLK